MGIGSRKKWNFCLPVAALSRSQVLVSLTQGSVADVEKANAATEELQKVRTTVTNQTASLRRHKERSEQLEDVIIDLKHDLDAAQAGKTAAEDAVAKAKAAAFQKASKLKTAEAAVAELRDELAQERAQQSKNSNAAQADIQSMLQSMQRQSDNALKALEQSHAVQLNDLKNRLDAVQAERNSLFDELNSTRSQLENAKAQAQAAHAQAAMSPEPAADSAPGGPAVPRSSGCNSSRAASPEAAASMQASIAELQQRNNRLQMALAAKHTAARPSQDLVDEVLSLLYFCLPAWFMAPHRLQKSSAPQLSVICFHKDVQTFPQT